MDPDMNKYDVEHVVTGHPKMTAEEWSGIYQEAWGVYYTDEHLETIMRRAYACGINLRSLRTVLFWFSSAVPVEGLHPLQWGIFRIKHRGDRRSSLPIESAHHLLRQIRGGHRPQGLCASQALASLDAHPEQG